MSPKESEDAGIDPESLDHLAEVKKGKPRKYVMVCKGTEVRSLVVYKKGSFETQKKAAKEKAKGQIYFGVVEGKGMDIRFLLARADGFEDAPVKNASLKDFLKNGADFACKPTIEIVDVLPEVSEEDDAVAPQSPGTDATVNPFQALYEGLLETIPQDLARLIKLAPDVGTKLQKVFDGAKAFATQGNFETAFQYLEKIANAIAEQLSSQRVQAASDVIPEGTVAAMKAALEKARVQWSADIDHVRSLLKPVHDALSSLEDDTALGLANIIDSYEEDLLRDIAAGEELAAKAGLQQAIETTLSKLQELREEALQDEAFLYLESCGVGILPTLEQAFDEVENLIRA